MTFRRPRTSAILVASLALLTSIAPGLAVETTNEFLASLRAGNREQFAVIVGLADGFAAANALLRAKGQPPLFCAERGLGTQNHIDILSAQIRQNPQAGSAPTGVVLLNALVAQYPCR